MRLVLTIAIVSGLGLGACSNTSLATATQTVCPSPAPDLTWENFGQQFMTSYCTDCHASTLTHAMRNGAPLFHDYDSLRGVLSIPDHIDKYAGAGPAAVNTLMPPSQCPSTPGGPLDRACPEPTDEERTNLALWIACETGK